MFTKISEKKFNKFIKNPNLNFSYTCIGENSYIVDGYKLYEEDVDDVLNTISVFYSPTRNKKSFHIFNIVYKSFKNGRIPVVICHDKESCKKMMEELKNKGFDPIYIGEIRKKCINNTNVVVALGNKSQLTKLYKKINKKKINIIVDEADCVFSNEDTAKQQQMDKLVELSKSIMFISATTEPFEYLKKFNIKTNHFFYIPEDKDYIGIDDKHVNIDTIPFVKPKDSEYKEVIEDIIPKFSAHIYKGKIVKGAIISTSSYTKDHRITEKIVSNYHTNRSELVYIVTMNSDSKNCITYTDNFLNIKKKSNKKDSLSTVMDTISEKMVDDKINYVYIIGGNQLIRSIDSRGTNKYTNPDDPCNELFFLTNLIYIPFSEKSDHGTMVQAMGRILGIYKYIYDDFKLNIFTTDIAKNSVLETKEIKKKNIDSYNTNENTDCVNVVTNMSEKFAKNNPIPKKYKENCIYRIGNKIFPTIESAEYYKSSDTYKTDQTRQRTEDGCYFLDLIRDKFERWGYANSLAAKFVRRIDPIREYTKQDLFNIAEHVGYKNTNTIIQYYTSKHIVDNKKNNYNGMLFEELDNGSYKIYPELVEKFNEIILKQ